MIFDSFSDILPGLLPASYRGISFFVPNTTTQIGRRVAEHLFPGIDTAAYDDLGLAPASIDIEGLIVGDHYIAAARALQAAFETPGPGTLLHPWFGPIQVIMDEPAEISLAANELRVVRFNATFKRYQAAGITGFASTASSLISAAFTFISIARALIISPSEHTMSRLRLDATQRAARQVTMFWQSTAGHSASVINGVIPANLAGTPELLAQTASHITDAILDLVPDIAGQPAVAPAAEAKSVTSGLSANDALALCLQAGRTFTEAAVDTISQPDAVLMLGCAGDALAKAGQLAAYVEFASRSEASQLRDNLVSGLDSYTDLLSGLAPSDFADVASSAIRATRDLRLCLIADINEAIGRLPASRIIETDRPVDAFQLANHIYGDNPAMIEDGYNSIIERNRLRHPAYIPAGRIEVTQ